MGDSWRFVLGFLIGAAWSATNLFFLIKLLKIAVLRGSKVKLSLILLVKFPVLYLIGLLILISRFFPTLSLLAGLAFSLLAAGLINIWPKLQ